MKPVFREIIRKTSRLSRAFSLPRALTASLKDTDSKVFGIIENEKKRQKDSLDLIASENYTSQAVLDTLGSVMQNKYSEGYPGARYYGGNDNIDDAERLCQERALQAFNLDSKKWGVNVQALSGSPANFAVYTAVLNPHDRLMALDLPHGGHLSHGYATPTRKVSAVSIYFESFPYRLNEETGYIDYQTMEKNALIYRPKLLITGASAYPRHIEYDKFRKVADKLTEAAGGGTHGGCLFMVDMAHVSGLIAGGVYPSPFETADIVTTTTHKSLRGPRGSLIFYRKGVRGKDKKGQEIHFDLEEKINHAVFPGHQGGPHNHTITAIAVALGQAHTAEFKEYSKQILQNSQALAKRLISKKYQLVSGGTDNHLVLVDLRPNGLNGQIAERILEAVQIACNKNTVPGDKSAISPSGIRLGTPALTTRGLKEKDIETVVDLIDEAIQIATHATKVTGNKKLKEFLDVLHSNQEISKKVKDLKTKVNTFANQFPVPTK